MTHKDVKLQHPILFATSWLFGLKISLFIQMTEKILKLHLIINKHIIVHSELTK